MIIGFSGTRHGMSPRQLMVVQRIIIDRKPELVLHGGCVGSDEQFDKICRTLDIDRRCYPADDVGKSMRFIPQQTSTSKVQMMDPRPALKRNALICKDADIMIATPAEPTPPKDIRGQGTWHTIRKARDLGMPLILVIPNGVSFEERGGLLNFNPNAGF